MKNAITKWALAGAAAVLLTVPVDAIAAGRHSSRDGAQRDRDRHGERAHRDSRERKRDHARHGDGRRHDRDRRAKSKDRERHDRYDKDSRAHGSSKHGRYRHRDDHRSHSRHGRYQSRDRHHRPSRQAHSPSRDRYRNHGHHHGRSYRHDRHSDLLQGLHFVAHIVNGLSHRNYDCGCSRRWTVGYWDSYRHGGRWYEEWVPGRWTTVRSCRRH